MYEEYHDLIVSDVAAYTPVPLTDDLTGDQLEWTNAYIDKEQKYFYLYRGVYLGKKSVLPGLYKSNDPNDKNGIRIIHPLTDEDKQKYEVATHKPMVKTEDIIRSISQNENNFTMAMDGKSSFLPDLSPKDDIIKRLLKCMIVGKGVDPDSRKDKFNDRNAVFNFKSNIKSEDARSSFRTLERGTNAYDVDVYVILVDKDPNRSVGRAISSPEFQARVSAMNDKAGINLADLPKDGYLIASTRDTITPKGDL